MADVELNRLNSQSFERLVRALAFAEMGPSGTVFSAGPDGARDFTLEGKIPGFESRSWDGYLVVQVKFKEALDGGQTDVDWLDAQIQREFIKFADENRKLRKPDYVLVATNIRLSGVDSSTKKGKRIGGHKKISDAFENWKKSLNLKDFHIWGGDQIVDLLMKHPGVRQSFGGFVLVGDVLTKLLDQFDAKQKDFSKIIQRAIVRRLSADQYVPLNESGSVDHKKIPTNKVFIDLPVSLSEEVHREPEELRGFVARLIDISKSKLDSKEQSNPDHEGGEARRVRGNIVLLGGPGQGKSTTGLFAIQLFRAAIIRENPLSNIDPTVRDLIPGIIERAQVQGLPTDIPRRFPVHVSLPGYADRISEIRKSNGDLPSLLAHIAHDLSRAADSIVDREDLRGWLSAYPWLVVLDGLDEVPPSGERPAVIEAIETFLSEIAQAHADVLVVVTSRPQGYNKDLSERHWRHWHLADLQESQAISYADALSLAQHPLDPDRQAKIRLGLQRAMQQPATARLMVSPLQVTIMHLIVDGGGSTPVGRWALFNEYYQVLKKREKAKGGETQEVLERNWDHLDPVHHRAGLVLQTEAERAGGAAAQFNPARLKALISGYLGACGYQGSDREVRAEELKRLVKPFSSSFNAATRNHRRRWIDKLRRSLSSRIYGRS